tara:strand:- start:1292 stop:2812 length:1521 start_codon:yes stop_codon:yes gene_type:complete
MTETDTNVLQVFNVSKSYPNVMANNDVSLKLNRGHIHALLGENGAGKSTLVKIIYGLVKPDQGKMTLNGVSYNPENPQKARKSGVGMVFQHFSLFDSLTVAQNILLGLEKNHSSYSLINQIVEISKNYGLQLNPKMTVGDLSAGERQRIEIVRCLLQNPKLLIMDEPTSVLTPNEIEQLFNTLKKLSSQGTTILYISHKLEEVRKLCDRATILRNGMVIKHFIPSKLTSAEIAESMVGKKVKPTVKKQSSSNTPILKVSNLFVKSKTAFGTNLKNISFEVNQGEILGIGGVAGSGQDELLLALTGESKIGANTIYYKNIDIGNLNPQERREIGLLTAPEERLGHAAAPQMSLAENCLITAKKSSKLIGHGWVNFSKINELANNIIKNFDVRTNSNKQLAKTLSGGNLQKFLIGRELSQKPDIIIINQPTWGVDASAAQFIRQALLDLVGDGTAAIIISQDLDELIEISDRFTAMVNGSISPPKVTSKLTISEIGLMLSTETLSGLE